MPSIARILVFASLALAWCGWFIQFVGQCGAQNLCTDYGLGSTSSSLAGLFGFGANLSCSDLFRWQWWITWFLFFALLIFSVFACIPSMLARSTLSWMAVFTILATLYMSITESYLATQSTIYGTTGRNEGFLRTAVAGGAIASAATLLLAFFLGFKQKVASTGQ